MFAETANCEKLTWITPDTDTANSRVSHVIPYIPSIKMGTKSQYYIKNTINPV